MTGIIKNSSDIFQCESIPATGGVYVFRNLPSVNGIIYIGLTENLREELKRYWESGEIPDVEWFDWYETGSMKDSLELFKKWLQKYTPKYN